MSGTGDSPQRATAVIHLNHARTHVSKHKIDHAIDEANLALEADPTFEEARYFLAELHEQLGEPRKAVHQYEELLFKHPNDEALLAKIEKLDPMLAARHRRMADIAPDPFVGTSRVGATGEDDLSGFDDMESVGMPGVAAPGLGAAAEGPTDLDDMEQFAEVESAPAAARVHVEAGVFEEDDQVGAPAQASVQPERYAYEDERQVRESVAAIPAVTEALKNQRVMWGEREALDELLAQTRPLTYTEHDEATNAFFYAASVLGANTTIPCLITDPSVWPILVGPKAAYVVVPTGALEALDATELYFLAGRTLGRVTSGHVGLLDCITALLPPPRSSSQLLDLLRATAARSIGRAEALGDASQRAKLQQHLHMWRLRAELTADRAGLVCCQSIDLAASAIAKLTAADAAGAARLSADLLEQRFSQQDLGQLANIGLDRDPATSEPYAYYRIRMLRWWSTQPAYAQLTATGQ